MLSLKNSKTSSAEEDRKVEEHYNDYPADFIEMQDARVLLAYSLVL